MTAARMWEGTGDLAAMVAWARALGGDVYSSPAGDGDPHDRVVLVRRFPDRASAEAALEPEAPAVRSHAWVFDVA